MIDGSDCGPEAILCWSCGVEGAGARKGPVASDESVMEEREGLGNGEPVTLLSSSFCAEWGGRIEAGGPFAMSSVVTRRRLSQSKGIR
jgi:hypothetical protein